jgi:hypothetical protein
VKLSYRFTYPLMVMLSLSLSTSFTYAEPLTLTDIMHFNTLQQPVIADDGRMMAVEAIKHLTGAGQTLRGRLMIYDALYADARVIATKRREGCAACGKHL